MALDPALKLTRPSWLVAPPVSRTHLRIFKALPLPPRFAHSSCSTSDNATVRRKLDKFCTPKAEGGLRRNDPAPGIECATERPRISDEDARRPDFGAFVSPVEAHPARRPGACRDARLEDLALSRPRDHLICFGRSKAGAGRTRFKRAAPKDRRRGSQYARRLVQAQHGKDIKDPRHVAALPGPDE